MHKLPKKTFMILWCIALCRLLMPFSIPSQASIFNLLNVFSVEQSPAPQISVMPSTDISYITLDPVLQPLQGSVFTNIAETSTVMETADVISNSGWNVIAPLTLVYLVGLAFSTMFFCMLYFKNRKEFMTSLPIPDKDAMSRLFEHQLKRQVNIRVSDKIITPLTYGILHPTILLPKDTDWNNENELKYVFAHEFVHIKRFDALAKLVMAAALCIHWFNPIVWLMCFLFNRDMEISCDEAVVKMFGETSKQGYALALIGMAERGSQLPVLYNNFSKYAIEERINAIMKMKKGTLTGTLAALVLVCTTATVFSTTGVTANLPSTSQESAQSSFEVVHTNQYQQRMPNRSGGYTYIDYARPTENCLSAQESAQIGVNAIEQYFDVNIDGVIVNMHYIVRIDPNDPSSITMATLGVRDPDSHIEIINGWANELGMTLDEILDNTTYHGWGDYLDELADKVGTTRETFVNSLSVVFNATRFQGEIQEQPSSWSGAVLPPGYTNTNSGMHEYSFGINAETGEIMRISYFPNIIDAIDSEPPTIVSVNMRDLFRADVNEEHNRNFSRYAMQIAQERNIFDSEVTRARISSSGNWHRGWEQTAVITVLVESENGESVQLSFVGFMEGEKELVSVDFEEIRGFISRIETDAEGNMIEDFGPFDWVSR